MADCSEETTLAQQNFIIYYCYYPYLIVLIVIVIRVSVIVIFECL